MFELIAQKFSSLFSVLSRQNSFAEKDLQELLKGIEEGLLEADVPYRLVQEFVALVRHDIESQKFTKYGKPQEQIIKLVHDKLVSFLGGKDQAVYNFLIPSTIMVMGLQGSGKTTTIAKLANFVQKEALQKRKSRKILLASIDFYRPAAIEQLAILSKAIGVDFYRAKDENPVRAAQEIQKYALDNRYELLFLDTAGRLHIDDAMLSELQKVDSSIQPKHKILVLDAMTGQESLRVAQTFDEAVGYHVAILSKTDSDSRGGAAFSFRYAQKKSIVFVGSGEKVDDLERFHPERAAGMMLGMGDLHSLLEKAQRQIKDEEQQKMQTTLDQGRFNLQDFADQMDMVGRLGSLSSLAKYIPGMASMKVTDDALEQGEREMRRFKAIICSMTIKERVYPRILNDSRKLRIAKGAGVEVKEINNLLSRFEQMQQYAKLIRKSGGLQNIFKGR